MTRSISLLCLSLLLAACSSVQLPREHYWRLSLGQPPGGELPRAGVLRVADLQLGNSLSGDCLLYADGEMHLEPQQLQRWVAPLDRLITDAVVLGLSRSRMFRLVKSASDPGDQDYTLHGRILDFAEHRGEAMPFARAEFAFWMEDAEGLVFQDELRAEVALIQLGPEGAVSALSQALQQVVDQLACRMRAAGVFRQHIDAVPGK